MLRRSLEFARGRAGAFVMPRDGHPLASLCMACDRADTICVHAAHRVTPLGGIMFHTVLASLANLPERPGGGHGSSVHEGGHPHYVGHVGSSGSGGGSDDWLVIVLAIGGTLVFVILLQIVLARWDARKSPPPQGK